MRNTLKKLYLKDEPMKKINVGVILVCMLLIITLGGCKVSESQATPPCR